MSVTRQRGAKRRDTRVPDSWAHRAAFQYFLHRCNLVHGLLQVLCCRRGRPERWGRGVDLGLARDVVAIDALPDVHHLCRKSRGDAGELIVAQTAVVDDSPVRSVRALDTVVGYVDEAQRVDQYTVVWKLMVAAVSVHVLRATRRCQTYDCIICRHESLSRSLCKVLRGKSRHSDSRSTFWEVITSAGERTVLGVGGRERGWLRN